MRKNLLGFLITLICCCQSFANAPDYFVYHQKINKAEELFFIHKNVDSSLHYYDEVFSDYDFIFLKDLVNASQIAYLSNKPYKHYLESGFRFGLKVEHLRNIQCFEKVFNTLQNDASFQKKYRENRKIYLEKIDQDILDLSYTIGIQDQLDKQKSNYNSQKHLDKLIEIIQKGNFPGERIIGIADASVFKDLQSNKTDLAARLKKYGEQLSYFEIDEQSLSSKMFMLILIHNFCSYNQLKKFWQAQIQKGNIHPRDVALVNDNMYRCNKCCETRNIYYQLNMFHHNTSHSRDAINKARKNLYIGSLEVDEAKKLFEKRTGAKLFWGFWNCR